MGKLAAGILIFLFCAPALSRAEWIDDWMNQKTYSGPQYYDSTNRFYGTFGQASARWNNSSEYMMGVTKPSWNKGCGGIDLFLGGFHFMKFDLLVDKFQQMMGPAAAAFAFDIALNALSAQSSNTIKTLSGIVDRLNQLQFDDCETADTVTAIMKAPLSDGFKNEAQQAVANYSLRKGLVDGYQYITKQGEYSNSTDTSKALGANLLQTVAGCPNDIKDIFFTPGYILDNLNDTFGNQYADDHIAMLRGLIGDVSVLTNVSGDLDYLRVSPCPKGPSPVSVTIDHFLNGDIQKRTNSDPDCAAVTILSINGVNYNNLRSYHYAMIKGVADSIVAKTPLTAAQVAFLNTVPGPLQSIIQKIIAIQGSSVNTGLIANQFIDYCSTFMIYHMVNDFFSQMNMLILKNSQAMENYKGTLSGVSQEDCNMSLAHPASMHLDDMVSDLSILSTQIQRDFVRKTDALANQVLIDMGFINVDAIYKTQAISKTDSGFKQMSKQAR